MRVTADKDALFNLLAWHGKSSPLGLVRMSVSEKDGPLVIESASSGHGWQRSILPAEESTPGQVAFSTVRLMAQKRLAKQTSTVTVHLNKKVVTTTVGRSEATSPAVLDVPEFWSPEGDMDPKDPFTPIASVDAAELSWLLRMGDAMRGADPSHPTHATSLLIEEGRVRLHSTDGYRMGFGEIASSSGNLSPRSHYVSPSVLSDALSIMGDAGTVELIEINGHLGLRGGASVMVRPSMAAGPPSMEGLLRQAHEATKSFAPILIPASDLSDALAGIGIGKNGATMLDAKSDHVVVSTAPTASETPGGTKVEVDASVPAELAGSSFTFNAANASAVLRQLRTHHLELRKTPRMMVFSEPESESLSGAPFLANISLVR